LSEDRPITDADRARNQADALNSQQSEVWYLPLMICPPAATPAEPEGTDAQATQEAAAELLQPNAGA